VFQLFNSDGQFMSYTEFLNTYAATPKEYSIVYDTIPSGVKMLFRSVDFNISSVPFYSQSIPI